MTPEELRKKASLSDDALDQANLKLALMRYDAERINDSMVKDYSFSEACDTLARRLVIFSLVMFVLALVAYLIKEFK